MLGVAQSQGWCGQFALGLGCVPDKRRPACLQRGDQPCFAHLKSAYLKSYLTPAGCLTGSRDKAQQVLMAAGYNEMSTKDFAAALTARLLVVERMQAENRYGSQHSEMV